jgi:hypothetical protein
VPLAALHYAPPPVERIDVVMDDLSSSAQMHLWLERTARAALPPAVTARLDAGDDAASHTLLVRAGPRLAAGILLHVARALRALHCAGGGGSGVGAGGDARAGAPAAGGAGASAAAGAARRGVLGDLRSYAVLVRARTHARFSAKLEWGAWEDGAAESSGAFPGAAPLRRGAGGGSGGGSGGRLAWLSERTALQPRADSSARPFGAAFLARITLELESDSSDDGDYDSPTDAVSSDAPSASPTDAVSSDAPSASYPLPLPLARGLSTHAARALDVHVYPFNVVRSRDALEMSVSASISVLASPLSGGGGGSGAGGSAPARSRTAAAREAARDAARLSPLIDALGFRRLATSLLSGTAMPKRLFQEDVNGIIDAAVRPSIDAALRVAAAEAAGEALAASLLGSIDSATEAAVKASARAGARGGSSASAAASPAPPAALAADGPLGAALVVRMSAAVEAALRSSGGSGKEGALAKEEDWVAARAALDAAEAALARALLSEEAPPPAPLPAAAPIAPAPRSGLFGCCG